MFPIRITRGPLLRRLLVHLNLPLLVFLLTISSSVSSAQPVREESTQQLSSDAVHRFADVDATCVFFNQINWMFDAGISNGWSSDSNLPVYGPKWSTKRDAMAAFMFRLAQHFNPELSS